MSTAQTNAGNAKVQANRYSELVKSDAVSQIDADTFNTQAAAAASAVKSAQANLQRLKELQSFEKVYAPFDGVVTAREVDTGQLINQGSGAELFHMQAIEIIKHGTEAPAQDTNSDTPHPEALSTGDVAPYLRASSLLPRGSAR